MIRPYLESDLTDVLDAWYRASLVAHSFLTDEFLARERQEMAERWLSVAETTVYEHDGRVIGFISMIGNEVGGLFVDPDHQGRGIGRALMDQARGSRPYLELGVFEANETGRRFYDRYGFEIVGRGINEEAGHPELRMRFEPQSGD